MSWNTKQRFNKKIKTNWLEAIEILKKSFNHFNDMLPYNTGNSGAFILYGSQLHLHLVRYTSTQLLLQGSRLNPKSWHT